MANELRFDGRVAIVTGAGGGLGRSHALLLASRGAKVVVNDLGGSMHGGGASATPAQKVVDEIKAAGGEGVANYDSVEDGAKIVQAALDTYGRIDIVINNAGILRDVSFHKMTEEDWERIYKVHVLGGFRVTHAAWNHMRDAGYGRVIFTASAAGIYGNFGQANYSMAKLGLLGLSNTLAIEGKKKNVLVNTIAPIAGSRLTETVMPKELVDALRPEFVSPLVAYLCHEGSTETGGLFEVGGGFFAKLRWQRSEGTTIKLGKPMTPEGIKKAWGAITGFDKVTYPPDITQSMQPVLANIQSKSKGGNEFIDVDLALGYQFPDIPSRYEERDLALYALGVGAGVDPLDANDLRYVYEMNGDGFRTLPTYAIVPVISSILERAKRGEQAPGLNYGFERILHGEQTTELKRPLPPNAKLVHKSRIKEIWDKGKHGVVIIETRTFEEGGDELYVNDTSMLVRGAGGWGGERGPTGDVNVAPERAPDKVTEQAISPSQALLYRLTGDWNPLHADPNFAQAFGFPRPILHGLCTFGYAGRHVVNAFCKGDARWVRKIHARFAESVFPGETLITEMWKEGDTKIIFRCKVKERDKVVISNAAIDLFTEIPVAKPKAAPAAAKAPAAAAPAAIDKLVSGDVFVAIRDYIEKTAGIVGQIGTVFQFKLTNPESAWTVDVKNGSGSVTAGVNAAADVTLELADSDFMDMTSGKADPQKLYFGGKLKISGNVMASQKLMFLKKVDPQSAMAAIIKARGGSAPAAEAPAAAAPASIDTLGSGDVFVAIRDYIEKTAGIVGQIGTVFQFKLTNPESAWTVDVKNGSGSVTAGVNAAADVTLELADSDFMDMTSGKADPQKLYFGGKLKISGNVMASQKLMFLKKVNPQEAMAAIVKARGASAPAASAAPSKAAEAPKAAAKESHAGAIFKAIGERLAQNPGLSGEVAAIVQVLVTDPEGAYALDLTCSPGVVKEGKIEGAKLTVKLADEDLVALSKGATMQDLFQRGKVRLDGEIRLAHKLGFMRGV